MFGTNEIVGQKYFRDADENQLFITSMFQTLQGEGPFRGEPAFFIRLAKCNLACSFCFVGNTKITMKDGHEKKIKDVQIDDEVVTSDNGVWSTKKVTNKFHNQVSKLLKLNFENGKEVITTLEHPFRDINFGWVEAQNLNVGDQIECFSEVKKYTVLTNKKVTDNKKTDVYNIEVEDTHNYVANGLLVHNCDTFFDDGDWMTFDQVEEKIEETIDQFYKDQGMDRPNWTYHENGKKKMVLVLTGGEPTLQKNIGPFLERMNKIFKNTQIESNGIVHQPSVPKETTLVISPKCIEKNGSPVKYIKPNKDNFYRADCFKFVMEADQDSPYCDIPEWAHEWADETNKDVFISPMNIYNDEPQKAKEIRNQGKNRIEIEERSTIDEVISFWEPGLLNLEENQKNHEYAAQFCVKHGYILNLQIHLYASLA